MSDDYEILDVHHHVGNAFRALGGPVDNAPEMDPDEYRQLELASRIEIMDRERVQQEIVIPGHGYLRIITPHDAGYSPLAGQRLGELFLANWRAFVTGAPLQNEVFTEG